MCGVGGTTRNWNDSGNHHHLSRLTEANFHLNYSDIAKFVFFEAPLRFVSLETLVIFSSSNFHQLQILAQNILIIFVVFVGSAQLCANLFSSLER